MPFSAVDWRLFGTTFALIFVSEFPDKTAFASLLLATKHSPLAVFLGAALAFVVQSAVAVVAGRFVGLLPQRWVHIGSACLFLLLAVWMWKKAGHGEEAGETPAVLSFWRAALAAFMTIFIAEWGDLTQIATATLVARYGAPLTIFISATLALWAVALIGVGVGHFARKAIHPVVLQRVAAGALAAVGLALFVIP